MADTQELYSSSESIEKLSGDVAETAPVADAFDVVDAADQAVPDTLPEPMMADVMKPTPVAAASPAKAAPAPAAPATATATSASPLAALPPRARDLVYWRDPKEAGGVFAAGLVTIYMLFFSDMLLVTLFSYVAVAVLIVNFVYVNGMGLLASFQKKPAENPHKSHIETPVVLPKVTILDRVSASLDAVECTLNAAKDTVLCKNNAATLKAIVALWALSYVLPLFSVRWILLLGFLAVFSAPKVYEVKQKEIDAHVAKATGKAKEVSEQVLSKMPPQLLALVSKKKSE